MTALPPDIREQIEKLERKHAENPEGRYFVPLANALRKAGDTRRAMAILQDGIEKHPEYVSAHIVLARCLQDDGSRGEAEARFKHVLTLDSQNLVALRSLGELAAGSGRLDDAEKWYALLLEVDPMNDEARSALDALANSDDEPAVAETGDSRAESPAAVVYDAAPAPSPPKVEASSSDAAVFGDGWGDAPEPAPLAPDVPAPETQADVSKAHDTEDYPADDQFTYAYGFRLGEAHDETFDEEGAVITETIAELYVRQGFYDRAIKVYRELIRRRGSDQVLEQRLARVERLAAGLPDLDPGIAGGVGPVAAQDAKADERPADPLVDSFADSFVHGFPAVDAAETSPLGGVSKGTGAVAEGLPTAVSGPSEMVTRPAVTIRDYLRSILTWTPASETIPVDGSVEPTAGEPSGGDGIIGGSWEVHDAQPGQQAYGGGEGEIAAEEPDFVEGYAWADRTDVVPLADLTHEHDPIAREQEPSASAGIPWNEQEVSLTSEPAEVAPSGAPSSSAPFGPGSSSAPVAEDDLFPWELPAASEPQRDHRRIEDEVPDVEAPVPASSDFKSHSPPAPEVDRPRDTFLMEASETTDTAAGANEPRPDRDEEDDDLESFQAWLRSLKR